MSRSIGSLEKKETSTFGMLLDRYMPYQGIWQNTYPPISNTLISTELHCISVMGQSCDCLCVCDKFEIRHILHKYANEDVSLGSWFIGLEVEHVDDRSMCCGTPPGTDSFSSHLFTNVSEMLFKNSMVSRVSTESTSGQCLCSIIRLDLQWDLQIRGENQGRSCQVC